MTLLTTKEVQDLFKVDKSTIYRMAEDGRIPAVKVGRQWRFPSEKLGSLLGGAASIPPLSPAPPAGHESLDLALQADTAQALADLAADLFGVMAVVTDMEGNALTDVANPCGYFTAAYDGVFTADRCADGWRRLGEDIDLEPHFMPSHLGFLCARGFIRQGSQLVGMVIVGGVAPKQWPPRPEAMAAIAANSGVTESTIRDHINEVYWIDDAHQAWILRNLTKVSNLISLLASHRSQLISKLESIAALAGTSPNTHNKETT